MRHLGSSSFFNFVGTAFITVLLSAVVPVAASDARLTAAERDAIAAELESSRAETLAMIAGLSDEAWTFKTDPERWSTAEVMEHLLLAERMFHTQVETALATEADPDWESKTAGVEESLRTFVPDRSQPVQAPGPLTPQGAMSRAEIVGGWLEARSKSLEMVRESDAPFKSHLAESPLGTFGASHWLLMAGLHNQRHNKQIAEILEDPRVSAHAEHHHEHHGEMHEHGAEHKCDPAKCKHHEAGEHGEQGAEHKCDPAKCKHHEAGEHHEHHGDMHEQGAEHQCDPAKCKHHEAGAHHEHGKHHEAAEHHGDGHHQQGMRHNFSDAARWSKVFDDPARDAWQKPAEVIALMEIEPGMTVVDIGAGTGYFLPHLASAVGAEGHVEGLDVEPDMVEFMQDRAAKGGFAQVAARHIPYDDPELADGSVDRILIVNTWHHIDDRAAYAAKLRKALKPDGRLVVVDYAKDSPSGPPPEHRLAPEQITSELAKGGFDTGLAEETLERQFVVVGRVGG